ncbi:MAG TPA: HAMP domain-containing sensor histidine kinase [Gemmatimonadales bacterium]|jgi:signal transduction histidine kinase|nr:HAMP domain-containing sensor histidine kinase [Gemmatimonadales bacterium]
MTEIAPPRRFRVTRGGVVTALLVLAFAVATVLAIQTYRVARYHRDQADRVLRDYAALAAARVAQRSASELYYYAIIPPLKALQRAQETAPRAPLPWPAALRTEAMEREARHTLPIRFTFRLDLPTGKLETAGAPVPHAVRTWLAESLPAHTRVVYDTAWHMGTVLGQPGGERRYVAYTVLRDKSKALRTAVGFEADPEGLRPFLSDATDKFPLLPRPLTGGVQYDSMGSVIITDRYGVELYRSPVQYTSPFTARDTIGTDMGDLYAQATIRAEVADQLIIGGLPKSRLPLILGLLAVTAVLIGTALVQLRREYELARLRTDFISGVSHELRTPLAQIRMFSETLVLGRVRSDEERHRSLAIIDQEARRLTHLVENLLHFSRAERQTARVVPEPTAVAPLVQEVLEGFAPLAAARGVSLRAEVTDGLVLPVDPGAVRQMLLNLLDNAVKYGPAGQTVTLGAAPGANGAARLWVDDCGPGIPRADRERVWERFWRLERDRGSVVAGSGIGLAVVRELATLHAGRTWVEDADSGGSRFVIELPIGTRP